MQLAEEKRKYQNQKEREDETAARSGVKKKK